MSNITRKTQTGSLMIEIIAVLGLLALITPLLFQQISRRNEEIINTQIATEIRAVKDAVAAYIQANEFQIAQNCSLTDENDSYTATPDGEIYACDAVNTADIVPFFSGTSDILADYNYELYGYTVPSRSDSAGNVSDYRPVIYATISRNVGESFNLRRAARIASLIGLDGGVVVQDPDVSSQRIISGMQGAWELDTTLPLNTIVAVTAFNDATNSAILKDVKLEHFQGKTMQADTAVATRMNVREFLSIGPNDITSCIENYGNNTVRVKYGQTEEDLTAESPISPECTPLFEVNGDTGVVYIDKGQIRTGQKIEASQSTAGETRETNTDGTIKYDEYQLDPAYTSVMNDIKLTSRGGARLSDILPNYVLKDIFYAITGSTGEVYAGISSGHTLTGNPWTVPIPSCPVGYAPAVTVSTSMVQGSGMFTEKEQLEQAIADQTPHDSYQGWARLSGGYRFIIGSKEAVSKESPNATGNWTITAQRYNPSDDSWVISDASLRGLIHTYCVYDESAFTVPEKDRPEE